MSSSKDSVEFPDLHAIVYKPLELSAVFKDGLIHPTSQSNSIKRNLLGPKGAATWRDYATVSKDTFLIYLSKVSKQYSPVPYLNPNKHYDGLDYFVESETTEALTPRLLRTPDIGDDQCHYVVLGPRGSGKTLCHRDFGCCKLWPPRPAPIANCGPSPLQVLPSPDQQLLDISVCTIAATALSHKRGNNRNLQQLLS